MTLIFTENIVYAETVYYARTDLVEKENSSCEGGKRRSNGGELRSNNASSMKEKLKARPS